MGTGYKPGFVLLVLLFFGSCVSSSHIPMGQEKREEVAVVYEAAPGLFHADYRGGHGVVPEEQTVLESTDLSGTTLSFFNSHQFFPGLLSDMGFHIEEAQVSFEFIHTAGQRTGLYILKPVPDLPGTDPKGTVFFFHGYFDHVAKFHQWYAQLLDAGYTVVAADLPGHGVSTGPRGEIEDFSVYGDFVEAVVVQARAWMLPEPWFASGHSTGSAALVIHGLSRHETPFTALFLGSPLGRSRCYWPAVAGSVLVRPFAFGIKADWRGDYSVNFVPLSWFRAQRRWVKTHKALLKSRSPFLHTPVYLAWGTKDDTLDLRYTQQFYEGLFLKEESRAFDNAKHNLYIDAVRQNDVFNAALGFFDLHYPR